MRKTLKRRARKNRTRKGGVRLTNRVRRLFSRRKQPVNSGPKNILNKPNTRKNVLDPMPPNKSINRPVPNGPNESTTRPILNGAPVGIHPKALEFAQKYANGRGEPPNVPGFRPRRPGPQPKIIQPTWA